MRAVRVALYPQLPDEIGLAVHVMKSHQDTTPVGPVHSLLCELLSIVGRSEEFCLQHYDVLVGLVQAPQTNPNTLGRC